MFNSISNPDLSDYKDIKKPLVILKNFERSTSVGLVIVGTKNIALRQVKLLRIITN